MFKFMSKEFYTESLSKKGDAGKVPGEKSTGNISKKDDAGDVSGKVYTGSIPKRYKAAFVILPIICFFICLCLGRMSISPGEVLSSILGRLGSFGKLLSDAGIGTEAANAQVDTVIWSIRTPRLVLAAFVGMGLSVSGCAFQSLFSNPLATPDTLGVASGASFGAALAMLLGARMIGVQVTALAFGLIAVMLTSLSGRGIGNSKNTPILAGIMIGSLFSALVSFIKFTADTESQLPAITYWLMGSMEGASLESLLLGAPPLIICTVIILLLRWRMNLLPLSDDEAVSSGVNLRLLRTVIELCATVITASCVSMCGQVGWVGLLVPHICRMKFGSNHVTLLPASVSIGAVFMMLVDMAARTISPKEIPVSVITAVIGAPFFIYLLRRKGGWNL